MSLIHIQNSTRSEVLDVREAAPRERHALISGAFERLAPGESFELVNDHDPKPLYYQFQAEHPRQVRWQYVQNGPDVWRVRIGRLHDLAATPILELVASYPELKDVLDGVGLDTCCGGDLSVAAAAAEHGIDPAPILEALYAQL